MFISKHISTGADLTLDALSGGASSSMFDASNYSGTLLGSFDNDLSYTSTPAPSGGSSSSSDTSDILDVVGKGLDVLGAAIPAFSGQAAKSERAEKAKLEAERLRLEQARLQAMAGLGPLGSASAWQQQQMQAAATPSGGMGTGTKVALVGIGLAGLFLLWKRKDD